LLSVNRLKDLQAGTGKSKPTESDEDAKDAGTHGHLGLAYKRA